MICPKCGSENTRIELVNKVSIKKKRNWVYWICGLWIIDMFLWFFFFLYRLIFGLILRIFKKPSYKTITKTEKHLICNNCGLDKKIK